MLSPLKLKKWVYTLGVSSVFLFIFIFSVHDVLEGLYREFPRNYSNFEALISPGSEAGSICFLCKCFYAWNSTVPVRDVFLGTGNYRTYLPERMRVVEMTHRPVVRHSVRDLLRLVEQLQPAAAGEEQLGGGRCVVVGSGGNLHGRRLGATIETYDTIFRMNKPPIAGFEEDVGSRTDFRLVYPESIVQDASFYANTSLVLVNYEQKQVTTWLQWLSQDRLDLRPSRSVDRIRVLNPLIPDHIHAVLNTIYRTNKRPTIGIIAVFLALQMCSSVDIAGFGCNSSKPNDPFYYYSDIPVSDRLFGFSNHALEVEIIYILILLQQGKIGQDLTGFFHNTDRIEFYKPLFYRWLNCVKSY